MAYGAFKFKDNYGNVVSFISGSGSDISFSGGTLDLSGMTSLTLGGLTMSGSITNALTASSAPKYVLTSSFNTYSSSLATTGSNLFKGDQTISGSIIPAVSASYDLGSVNYPFRHLYLSSASLYVNGTKVLGSTAQELQITTDNGQSFKILESGSDTITLQSTDGNITLASSGGGDVVIDPTNGVIGLKGTVTVYTGNKIVSSDGNSVQFGNGIAITGSIVSTVTPLVSGSSQIIYSGLTGIPSGIISGSSQLTSSYDGRYVLSGSITQTTWDNIASKPLGIASGSSQIDITGTTGYSTFSSSISTSIGSLSSSVATTTSGLSSSIGSLSSSVATTTSGLSSSIGSLSSSIATTTLGTKNRVDSIEAKTGSYATTGSNIFKDNQTISGSLIVTQNLTVFGSSSITYVTSSQLRVDDNIITLNTSSPGSRFGGLEVYDSGSVTQATGSILWDSVNNRWVYQQSSEATYGGGILMSGPRSSGSLGSELTLTSNRVAKSVGGDHLNDTNITDDGTTVSINSNSEITGTLKITGTIVSTGTSIFSGSGQVIASLPAGTVSGSAQVLSGTGIWSGSAQLPSGVVSGSAQTIANLPSGTVSGSSQITLSSTTGFGTYLNQAVLSSSSPTFAGLTSSGAATFSSNLTVSGTTILGSYVSSNITLNTDYKIIVRQASMTLDAVTPSWFGYSTGYGIVKLGSTDANRSLAFNVDVSGNPSGAFSGNGSEYVWRNVGSFITPNAANTAYNTLLTWNSSGQITVSNTATFSGTVKVAEYRIVPNGTNAVYNIVDATNTYAGQYNIQAGGGSSAYGGSIVMYGHSHATRAGYVSAGISSGSGGKFTVQNAGNGQGTDVFTIDANGATVFYSTASPSTNGTIDLGSASYRWSTVYTSDLSMSNGIGDYTIVEGEEDLFLYNNKNNKVFKFMLQEVDPTIAPPKKV